MARWIRFEHQGQTRFGTLDGETIAVHAGDMFDDPRPTGETVSLSGVKVLTPCTPSKMICLWNNFHALAERLGVPERNEPLYFLKSPSAFFGHGETIRRPRTYAGNVIYEGELGIVIGRRCSNVSVEEAAEHVFGYTCIDDVTAADIISTDPTFAQWAREELRYVWRVRPGDRHRPRSLGRVRAHRARRQGATELPDQQHDPLTARGGEHGLQGHDAGVY